MRRGAQAWNDHSARRGSARVNVELLSSGIVPVCVVIMMFGVGLNLTLASLGGILANPRSLLVGTVLQIVLLPALAIILIAVFAPAPIVALALVAVASSPGGALSNVFTRLVGGNLALSVVMTTVTTLLVSATAPAVLAVALASGVLEQGGAARLDPLQVGFDLMQLALLPIGLGLLTVQVLPRFAGGLRRAADALGVVAFATVLVATTIVSLPALQQTASGPLLYAVLFSLGSLGLGVAVSRILPPGDRSACFMEFGLRNLPVALFLAGSEAPSVDLVAFLFCYFLANSTVLLATGFLARSRPGRVVA
jgi:bile acid:Na+ symporter, BASS family